MGKPSDAPDEASIHIQLESMDVTYSQERERSRVRLSPDASIRERFTNEGVLGRGGMGCVYEARDGDLGRRIAIKVLDQRQDRSDSPLRFRREAQIVAQLEHPNIVPIYDLSTADGRPTLTMRLVRGETLSEFLQEVDLTRGRGLEKFLTIFMKICDAIAYAHSRGVVHRDLKPHNIMVGDHGEVYVMDWGCAFVIPNPSAAGIRDAVRIDSDLVDLDQPGTVLGTVSYMAPEQALGDIARTGPAADIFGLGAILYYALSGQGPHSGESFQDSVRRAQNGDVRPLKEVARESYAPHALCAIAMKALRKDPQARHGSASELREDVARFLRGGWFETRTFVRGTTIVREGDPVADSAYIISSGACEVSKLENGAKVVVRRLGPGDVFGEAAILTRQARSATVIALEETHVLEIKRDSLVDGFAADSWMGTLVRALAHRFRILDLELSAMRKARSPSDPQAPVKDSSDVPFDDVTPAVPEPRG